MMYKTQCFIFVLAVSLLGGFSSCADDLSQEPMDYYYGEGAYRFDENGVPYKGSGNYNSPGPGEIDGDETFKGSIDWNQIIGYDWEPSYSNLILEDGSTVPVYPSTREEMNIYYQSYYIRENLLSTTYRKESSTLFGGTTYTEEVYYSAADIYACDPSASEADNFRLRILDVMQYDQQVVMRAIEPLCIEYYGDNDEGRIIYGETIFQRCDHNE